ncbi:hypothetical protein RISK_001802 [Rhodopirellula islandica]|uniref:Uncharacterized protein n=1 Tax=Rhodopirellula islandica TaxID=595434 RepID=A0A0J1BHD8_RHOIS|nr:hypothetical protein RISK_001802 [Rhodopirellula islandica]
MGIARRNWFLIFAVPDAGLSVSGVGGLNFDAKDVATWSRSAGSVKMVLRGCQRIIASDCRSLS